MRIAFDLDGVLVDLHRAFALEAVRLFPALDIVALASPDVGASPPPSTADFAPESDAAMAFLPEAPPLAAASAGNLSLTDAQSHAVWRSLMSVENFWETLAEIDPGTIARLGALADERRWEVLFVTSRPRSTGRTVQRQSQRWLQQHGFPMPSVYTVRGSRGDVAKALRLDVVIDDRPEHCTNVALESHAGAMLVWRRTGERPPISVARLGISVLPSASACLDALVEIGVSEAGSGVLTRLRDLFGLPSARRPRTRAPKAR